MESGCISDSREGKAGRRKDLVREKHEPANLPVLENPIVSTGATIACQKNSALDFQGRASSKVNSEFFPEGWSEQHTSKAATEATWKGVVYVYQESQRMGKREWRQKQHLETQAKNFPELMKDKSQMQALKKFSKTKTTTLNISQSSCYKNWGQK